MKIFRISRKGEWYKCLVAAESEESIKSSIEAEARNILGKSIELVSEGYDHTSAQLKAVYMVGCKFKSVYALDELRSDVSIFHMLCSLEIHEVDTLREEGVTVLLEY